MIYGPELVVVAIDFETLVAAYTLLGSASLTSGTSSFRGLLLLLAVLLLLLLRESYTIRGLADGVDEQVLATRQR